MKRRLLATLAVLAAVVGLSAAPAAAASPPSTYDQNVVVFEHQTTIAVRAGGYDATVTVTGMATPERPDAPSWTITKTGQNSPVFTFRGLTPGETYWYQVVDSDGNIRGAANFVAGVRGSFRNPGQL